MQPSETGYNMDREKHFDILNPIWVNYHCTFSLCFDSIVFVFRYLNAILCKFNSPYQVYSVNIKIEDLKT